MLSRLLQESDQSPVLKKISSFRNRSDYTFGDWRITVEVHQKGDGVYRKRERWTSWYAYNKEGKEVRGSGNAKSAARQLSRVKPEPPAVANQDEVPDKSEAERAAESSFARYFSISSLKPDNVGPIVPGVGESAGKPD